jgi:signal peptidase II
MSADVETPAAAATEKPRPWLAWGLALVIIVLDQLTKLWIVQGLHFGEGSTLHVFGPFRLTFVYNQGMSFGLLQSTGLGRWLLAAFAAGVSIALVLWARQVSRTWLLVGIGLVIGGAVGNLIDRIYLGQVIDFLDFSAMHFPWVFNVADAGISVGVVVILLAEVFTPGQKAAP